MPWKKDGASRVEISEFKTSVGKYPTGVTIISTKYQDSLFGFTANSFTSVSLSPSLVSFCLSNTSGSIEAFKKGHNFGVSILAFDQSDLSTHFASRHKDKFRNVNHFIGEVSDCPLIFDAVCWIECSKYRQIECGDHYIFIGEVKGSQILNNKSPLIYFGKAYREIK